MGGGSRPKFEPSTAPGSARVAKTVSRVGVDDVGQGDHQGPLFLSKFSPIRLWLAVRDYASSWKILL